MNWNFELNLIIRYEPVKANSVIKFQLDANSLTTFQVASHSYHNLIPVSLSLSLFHSPCRFCVGDRFYLCENKILCEYDYEERLVFASMANHPMLKRHVSSLGQGSPTGAAGGAGNAGGLLGGGPGGVTGGANVNGGGVGGGMVNGPRTPGDHNNNNGPQTPTGGGVGVGSPFAAAAAAAAAAHMKNQLGASS